MKQYYNVGIATLFGIDVAIIVDIMVSFCKCAKKCPEYNDNGKVFVPREEIRNKVITYMSASRMQRALELLKIKGFIEIKENKISRFKSEFRYTFSDKAKEVFSKNPIRITITWQ